MRRLAYGAAQAATLLRLVQGRGRPAWLPESCRPRAESQAWVMLAVSALAGAGPIWSPLLLWVWIVPVPLGQPALRLYVLAEHGDCPRTADCFETMRTTFTSAALRGLAWNMPSHAGHHPAPPVPFHALPALHRRVRARLRTTAPGHVAVTRADLARRP